MTALVTGGTGFLGAFVIAHLLKKGCRVIALARGPSPEHRLLATLRRIDGTVTRPGRSPGLEVLSGDVAASGLAVDEARLRTLAREVDEIWHCAATFSLRQPHGAVTAHQNVQGAANILGLAARCRARGRPATVIFVSTAYAARVVGDVGVEEVALPGQPARNAYEWSKCEAERLVDRVRRRRGLPVLIVRPSIVIGHSTTGEAIGWNGYFAVVRALYRARQRAAGAVAGPFHGHLGLRVRAAAEARLPVVPIDALVEVMWHLVRGARGERVIFNVTGSGALTVGQAFAGACEALGVTGVELVGEESFRQRRMTPTERLFEREARFQLAYLTDDRAFDQTNLRRVVSGAVLRRCEVDPDVLVAVNRACVRRLERETEAAGPGPRSRAGVEESPGVAAGCVPS
jgi:nucleoside-diphosphate-sugar epimerase